VGDFLAPAIVERQPVQVLFKRGADEQASITRVWRELEEAIGSLRGRKFYGIFDAAGHEYRACVEIREGEDAVALGLERATLPGGRYARIRLQGEPPGVYARIAPAFQRLAQRADVDRDRPGIEFYRRSDVIDLLQPVA
jgi:predicted transcriptional regulator YdeE